MEVKTWVVVSFFVLLHSCTERHCRKDGTLIVPKAPDNRAQQLGKKVFVFKPDGSKQCQKGKGIPLEVMVKQLEGIKIYSQESKMDGLMRIQACGIATGQVNIY